MNCAYDWIYRSLSSEACSLKLDSKDKQLNEKFNRYSKMKCQKGKRGLLYIPNQCLIELFLHCEHSLLLGVMDSPVTPPGSTRVTICTTLQKRALYLKVSPI